MPKFSDWSRNPETVTSERSWLKKTSSRWDSTDEEPAAPDAGEVISHNLTRTSEEIAVAAYYKAEKRGFEPGHDVEDWLEAESELNQADD